MMQRIKEPALGRYDDFHRISTRATACALTSRA
jgi:hypothetical protein